MSNDFLVWAPGGGNVMSQAAYAANGALANGVTNGLADPTLNNKSMRQATIIASMLAQFIANVTSQNSVDDGTITTLLTNFEAALALIVVENAGGRLLAVQAFESPGTFAYTPTVGTMSSIIQCQGGCGGSGGLAATSAGQWAISSGANAGALVIGRYAAASHTIIVGAGGAAGTSGGGNGGDGGQSSVSSLISANGGFGSIGGSANSLAAFASVVNTTGASCSGGNLLNLNGNLGTYSVGVVNGGTPSASAGPGAGSPRGQAGGGAAVAGSTGGTVGNAGTPGLVIIADYA